jgi:hypothetical protein
LRPYAAVVPVRNAPRVSPSDPFALRRVRAPRVRGELIQLVNRASVPPMGNSGSWWGSRRGRCRRYQPMVGRPPVSTMASNSSAMSSKSS